jgi:hypothetical protein
MVAAPASRISDGSGVMGAACVVSQAAAVMRVNIAIEETNGFIAILPSARMTRLFRGGPQLTRAARGGVRVFDRAMTKNAPQ